MTHPVTLLELQAHYEERYRWLWLLAVIVGTIKRRNAPLMNLALFDHRAFAMASMVAFIYGMALFGSTYLLPVYMSTCDWGWSRRRRTSAPFCYPPA